MRQRKCFNVQLWAEKRLRSDHPDTLKVVNDLNKLSLVVEVKCDTIFPSSSRSTRCSSSRQFFESGL
jgi:hypothetical protein